MRDAVIVDAVRTPVGRGKPTGAYAGLHPVELHAHVLRSLVDRVGLDPGEVDDVIGGAPAIGHPLGASGARLATTLLGVLERTGGRYGLQTMCEAGGTADATIVERLDR